MACRVTRSYRDTGIGSVYWCKSGSANLEVFHRKVPLSFSRPSFSSQTGNRWSCIPWPKVRPTKEIACELRITVLTVKAHMKNIMGKTKSSTRTGILAQVLCP